MAKSKQVTKADPMDVLGKGRPEIVREIHRQVGLEYDPKVPDYLSRECLVRILLGLTSKKDQKE